MDRRFFLTSLLGVAGASAASVLLMPKAHALPLLEELQAMEAEDAQVPAAAAAEADLPAPGASQAQYYYGPPPGYYRRRPRRYYVPPYEVPPPRMRRCRFFYDRWGQLVRRCWWG